MLLTLPIVFVIAALDQLTKYLILHSIPLHETWPIIPELMNLTLTFNKGAAFGVFSNIADDATRHFILGLATAFALGVVIYYLLKHFRHSRIALVALGLILGGALGNLIDRGRYGAVVDFIDFYVGQYHWPAFNVADSAICIGMVLLFILRPEKEQAEIKVNTVNL